MINNINTTYPRIQPKPVSFTSMPLYNINVPKLVNNAYELTPAVFSRLNPSDANDVKMVLKNKNKFKFKAKGEELTIPELFTTKDYRFVGNYKFYAIEIPNKAKNKNELLGLMTTDNINSSNYRLFVDMIDVRSDLQKKNGFFRFGKRKYTNVGELLLYGAGKTAKDKGASIFLGNENSGFYDKIKMQGKNIRKFFGEDLANFIKTTEEKFKISNPSI